MVEKKKEIINLLKSLNIYYEMVSHKEVYTINEMLQLNLPKSESVAKNLFVRDDKKRNYYLIVVREEKKVELKKFREKIASRPLSFASEDDLNSILELSKGSVTPFGIINDKKQKVKVFIDNEFKDDTIGVHPNDNTATIWLKTNDLVKIIEQHGNLVEFIEI